MYEFTSQPGDARASAAGHAQLFGAIYGNREAMDGFVRMNGTGSPAEFLSPKNIGAVMSGAKARN